MIRSTPSDDEPKRNERISVQEIEPGQITLGGNIDENVLTVEQARTPEETESHSTRQEPEPSHDQPSFDQPSYGQPSLDQPSYGQQSYGQPSVPTTEDRQETFQTDTKEQEESEHDEIHQRSKFNLLMSNFGRCDYVTHCQNSGSTIRLAEISQSLRLSKIVEDSHFDLHDKLGSVATGSRGHHHHNKLDPLLVGGNYLQGIHLAHDHKRSMGPKVQYAAQIVKDLGTKSKKALFKKYETSNDVRSRYHYHRHHQRPRSLSEVRYRGFIIIHNIAPERRFIIYKIESNSPETFKVLPNLGVIGWGGETRISFEVNSNFNYTGYEEEEFQSFFFQVKVILAPSDIELSKEATSHLFKQLVNEGRRIECHRVNVIPLYSRPAHKNNATIEEAPHPHLPNHYNPDDPLEEELIKRLEVLEHNIEVLFNINILLIIIVVLGIAALVWNYFKIPLLDYIEAGAAIATAAAVIPPRS